MFLFVKFCTIKTELWDFLHHYQFFFEKIEEYHQWLMYQIQIDRWMDGRMDEINYIQLIAKIHYRN